jgi:hypothetical protein
MLRMEIRRWQRGSCLNIIPVEWCKGFQIYGKMGTVSDCTRNIGEDKLHSFTYDHRTLKIRLPVRSAIYKQCTGGLVVRWVTTSESPLLYVFFFLYYVFFLLSTVTSIKVIGMLVGRIARW